MEEGLRDRPETRPGRGRVFSQIPFHTVRPSKPQGSHREAESAAGARDARVLGDVGERGVPGPKQGHAVQRPRRSGAESHRAEALLSSDGSQALRFAHCPFLRRDLRRRLSQARLNFFFSFSFWVHNLKLLLVKLKPQSKHELISYFIR